MDVADVPYVWTYSMVQRGRWAPFRTSWSSWDRLKFLVLYSTGFWGYISFTYTIGSLFYYIYIFIHLKWCKGLHCHRKKKHQLFNLFVISLSDIIRFCQFLTDTYHRTFETYPRDVLWCFRMKSELPSVDRSVEVLLTRLYVDRCCRLCKRLTLLITNNKKYNNYNNTDYCYYYYYSYQCCDEGTSCWERGQYRDSRVRDRGQGWGSSLRGRGSILRDRDRGTRQLAYIVSCSL